MTTGQPEYWARWGSQGPELQEVFRLIDPALIAFAETNRLEVSRWRGQPRASSLRLDPATHRRESALLGEWELTVTPTLAALLLLHRTDLA